MTKKTPMRRLQNASSVAAFSLRNPSQYASKPPGRKSRTRSETASSDALPTFGNAGWPGNQSALVVPERTELELRALDRDRCFPAGGGGFCAEIKYSMRSGVTIAAKRCLASS